MQLACETEVVTDWYHEFLHLNDHQETQKTVTWVSPFSEGNMKSSARILHRLFPRVGCDLMRRNGLLWL